MIHSGKLDIIKYGESKSSHWQSFNLEFCILNFLQTSQKKIQIKLFSMVRSSEIDYFDFFDILISSSENLKL